MCIETLSIIIFRKLSPRWQGALAQWWRVGLEGRRDHDKMDEQNTLLIAEHMHAVGTRHQAINTIDSTE